MSREFWSSCKRPVAASRPGKGRTVNIGAPTLFEKMYRKGSVSKAAEACFMTPQGANRALRGFEVELR